MSGTEWRPYKIRHLPISIIDGDRSSKYPKRDEFLSAGVIFLNSTSFVGDSLDLSKVNYISEQKYSDIKKGRVDFLDTVLTTRGNGIGKTILYKAKRPALVNAQMVILRGDKKTVDQVFLNFVLRSSHVQELFKRFASGSAQPQLPIQDLREIEISLPSLLTQRKIAAVLSAYDDLIENNTRRIQILEEMAGALYREWFVEFRFPGHENVPMVETELGKMPQGWTVKPLSAFGRITTGKTPNTSQKEFYGDFLPFIKTPDMHGQIFCVSVKEYLSESGAESQRSKILPPNSICVSCIGTAGVVSMTTRNSQTNQQINAISLTEQRYREFLYFRAVDLKEKINLYGGNGATMVNLNKSKFESLEVICPGKPLIDQFNRTAGPMFDKIRNILFQNANLRHTRDLLLPKLVSGEVDVSDIDITLEKDDALQGALP